MAKPLTHDEIKSKITNLEFWELDNNQKFLHREFTFQNFVDAFSFMTKVALIAEKINHHPNWENVYNRVIINLSTHSVDGLSQLDFDLAKRINDTYAN